MKPNTPNTPVPEKFPRLSKTLKPFRTIDTCQSCGATSGTTRFQECDDNDKAQALVVCLCPHCAVIIDQHPRLYRALEPNEPFPGAMEICYDCKFREVTHCRNRRSVWNGGHGLKVDHPKPEPSYVDHFDKRQNRTRKRMIFTFESPARSCDGKEIG